MDMSECVIGDGVVGGGQELSEMSVVALRQSILVVAIG